MKKILIIFFMILSTLSIDAKSSRNNINSIINDYKIDKNSVAISVRSLDSGKNMYALNEKMLMHPASVQKILTVPAAINVLGRDYEFKTGIYKRNSEEYIIKLSADPYLSTNDLKKLVKNINQHEIKTLYIDSSVVELKDWGEGWQWDDDMNLCMPRFNSYNLDKNIIKITIVPDGEKTLIINPSKYPLVFINNVVISDKTDIKAARNASISSNTIELSGTINKPVTISIPVNNLKHYFTIRLTQQLEDRNIYLKNQYMSQKVNEEKLLEEISHPVLYAVDDIFKNSNNMAAEVVLKVAGGKAYNKTGTDTDGVKLFNDYCKKIGIDNSNIRIVDASGVSKNNLVNADFIAEYLVKNKNNSVLENMAKPGEGTLEARMIPLKDNLRAKTGTLSDISSIAGYLNTKKGTKTAFCIIINNPKLSSSEKKVLEDYIIREIYMKN